jgi:multimeric flavodoxin WrbA
MIVTCICGSPKGAKSVTMQYANYLQMKYPHHQFNFIHAAQHIERFERNTEYFEEALEKIKPADLVLWVFPLYILNVHGGLKRFIELIFERQKESLFEGKYAAAISTSINFYDNTAHNYINAISDELGMKYIDYFSAHMGLLNEKGGVKKLLGFADYIFDCMLSGITPAKNYEKITDKSTVFQNSACNSKKITSSGKIVVIADRHDTSLDNMIACFKDFFEEAINISYLSDISIKDGCRGCLKCGPANNCFYDKKDQFREFFDDIIKTYDIIVIAGKIRDRYLSAAWKTAFDRLFYNTHQRTFTGKQIGFIISGPFKKLSDLKEILTSYFEFQHSNIVDFVSDDTDDNEVADNLHGLAQRLVFCAEHNYIKPSTFRAIAGMKIFRDEIYGGLKIIFRADHRNYAKTGVYDFPQKNIFKTIFYRLGYLITSIGFIQRRMIGNMPDFMVMPYKHLFNGEG